MDRTESEGGLTPGAHWGAPRDLDAAGWRPLADGEVAVWLFDLEAPAARTDRRMVALSADEHARAQGFVFERDRLRFLVAHATLRALLSRCTGEPADRLAFATLADGKPAFAAIGLARQYAFNLSHSGRWGLIGVSRAGPIGVDIEVHRPMPDADAIAKTHFSRTERTALASLPCTSREAAFFACWTRKEAYVKAIGTGLATPLHRFDVAFLPSEAAALRSIDGSPEAARAWTLTDLDSRNDSSAAVAVQAAGIDVQRFRCT